MSPTTSAGTARARSSGEASWQRLLVDHLEVMRALGIEHYHLVGHDWGGAIGLHVARYQPETLRSLVVLDTNYWETDLRGMWHLAFLNLPALAAIMFRLAPDLVFDAFLTRSIAHRETVDQLEVYRATFHDRDATSFWIRLYRNMARGLVRQRAPAVLKRFIRTSNVTLPPTSNNAFQVDTLLIWGGRDTFNPEWVGRGIEQRLADLGANVRFELVPDAKHFVPEDAPDVVATQLQAHVRRVDLAADR